LLWFRKLNGLFFMSINIFGEIILLLIVGHFNNDVELERCGTEEKICATVLRPDGSKRAKLERRSV
jgi:hypothetical protein